MSSHREAPEISKDPGRPTTPTPTPSSAPTGRTRSPSSPTTSRSRIPPAGRTSSSSATTCSTRSTSTTTATARPTSPTSSGSRRRSVNPNTFLYNTGPITSLDGPDFNRAADLHRHRACAAAGAAVGSPPTCRRRRATSACARRRTTRPSPTSAIFDLGNGIKVFAGQRLDGFFVDLGSIFDLAALRPFQNLHLIPTAAAAGRQRAARRSTSTRSPSRCRSSPADAATASGRRTRSSPKATIGVYGAAYRQKARVPRRRRTTTRSARSPRSPGSATRCSTRSSCRWAARTSGTASHPSSDNEFAQYVARPELGQLLPVLYPGVFPNLAALNATRPTAPTCWRSCSRGSRPGSSRGSRTSPGRRRPTCCGSTWRSRRAPNPNVNGILGGDLAGFPNGRRVFDDIVTVELRAVAGLTIPLVDPTFTPDGAAGADQRRHAGPRRRHLPRHVPVPGPPGQRLRRAAAVGRRDGRPRQHAPPAHPHGPLESIRHVHGGAPGARHRRRHRGARRAAGPDGAAGTELHLRADGAVGSDRAHRGVDAGPRRRSPRRCSPRSSAAPTGCSTTTAPTSSPSTVRGGEVVTLDLRLTRGAPA